MRTVIGLLALAAATAAAASVGSVTLGKDGMLTFHKDEIVNGAIASASYVDQVENAKTSGFGKITVKTTAVSGSTPVDQFRAAGYVEGIMTQHRMRQHSTNIRSWLDNNFANKTVPPAFEDWFRTQDKWLRASAAKYPTDARWQGMLRIVTQLDGLVEGYNEQAPEGERMTLYDWQLIQATGDIFDLIPKIMPSQAVDWHHMPVDKVMSAVRASSHCSGLIRVTGDMSDLFMSHVAWFNYGSMLRIFKTYDFDVPSPGRRTAFSSYPGLLSSLDDFYMNSPSQLGMVQTTNNVFNKELYKYTTPQSLFAWQRVRGANLVADTGEEWVEVIRADNSGTYNNAYMTVDYKRFTAGKALRNGTLWYSEQIPGLVEGADVTNYLAKGYWASYNVPFFRTVYDRSGYPQMVARAKEAEAADALAGLDYQMAPRAQIFRRDAFKANDIPSLQTLMRSNNYKTDPYGHDDPWDAICSRGDLASRPSTNGCYDGKAASAEMVRSLRAFVVNGPTTSDGALPPFRWTPEFNSTAHVGQFDTFDFDWQEMGPDAL